MIWITTVLTCCLCVNPWYAWPGGRRACAGAAGIQKVKGCKVPRSGVRDGCACLLRAGRPRQSDIDELSRRGARRLGGGALHRSPRQSRENMKQVSVRSIFGSSTHHPCLSTLGGRSRHIHAMRWMGWGRLSAGAGAGAGQTRGRGSSSEWTKPSWFGPVWVRSGSTGGERLSCLGHVEPCGGALWPWQTVTGTEINVERLRLHRRSLHGRESRLPCSRPCRCLWVQYLAAGGEGSLWVRKYFAGPGCAW